MTLRIEIDFIMESDAVETSRLLGVREAERGLTSSAGSSARRLYPGNRS